MKDFQGGTFSYLERSGEEVIIIGLWDISSAGRAPRSQRGGRRFDPAMFHHFLFPVVVVQSHLSEVGQNDVSIDSRPKGRFSCVSNWGFRIILCDKATHVIKIQYGQNLPELDLMGKHIM